MGLRHGHGGGRGAGLGAPQGRLARSPHEDHGQDRQQHECRRTAGHHPLLARRPQPGDRRPDVRGDPRHLITVTGPDRRDGRVHAGNLRPEQAHLLGDVERRVQHRLRVRDVPCGAQLAVGEVRSRVQVGDAW